MKIVEYKLHASPAGMSCPGFIKEGGYWRNPDDHTMIGIIPSNSEYYVPDTIVELTAEELEKRQLAIHAKHPMRSIKTRIEGIDDGSNRHVHKEHDMTIAEIKTAISNWVTARSN